ncbi:hypothetical protein ACLOJK_038252 [Asimina triloba]
MALVGQSRLMPPASRLILCLQLRAGSRLLPSDSFSASRLRHLGSFLSSYAVIFSPLNGSRSNGCSRASFSAFPSRRSSSPLRTLFGVFSLSSFVTCSTSKAKRALVEAQKLESHLLTSQPSPQIFLLNRDLETFAKCGSIRDARKLFDEMPCRDGGTWNAMITAYAQEGPSETTLRLFSSMRASEVLGNSLVDIYGKCQIIGDVQRAFDEIPTPLLIL